MVRTMGWRQGRLARSLTPPLSFRMLRKNDGDRFWSALSAKRLKPAQVSTERQHTVWWHGHLGKYSHLFGLKSFDGRRNMNPTVSLPRP